MAANVAAALNINVNQIGIKATTEEGLGFTGEGRYFFAGITLLIKRHNKIYFWNYK